MSHTQQRKAQRISSARIQTEQDKNVSKPCRKNNKTSERWYDIYDTYILGNTEYTRNFWSVNVLHKRPVCQFVRQCTVHSFMIFNAAYILYNLNFWDVPKILQSQKKMYFLTSFARCILLALEFACISIFIYLYHSSQDSFLHRFMKMERALSSYYQRENV